jgi:DNA helicase-2/ATP-dependent DNA helicase PcrA
MAWNDDLSGKALEVAACDKFPLRVIAGPGTGKTFALMRRVARLLEQGQDPRRLLLVTFTRVAARDLERELNSLHVPRADFARKGTLHSFCFSVLNQANVLKITGRVPRPLLNYEERFLLEDLGQHDFGDYYGRKRKLRAFEAAWAREQDQDPGWPDNETDRRFQGVLEEWLRFHRAMLVGELVPVALSYLRNNPACPERLQFDHVLIDQAVHLPEGHENRCGCCS